MSSLLAVRVWCSCLRMHRVKNKDTTWSWRQAVYVNLILTWMIDRRLAQFHHAETHTVVLIKDSSSSPELIYSQASSSSDNPSCFENTIGSPSSISTATPAKEHRYTSNRPHGSGSNPILAPGASASLSISTISASVETIKGWNERRSDLKAMGSTNWNTLTSYNSKRPKWTTQKNKQRDQGLPKSLKNVDSIHVIIYTLLTISLLFVLFWFFLCPLVVFLIWTFRWIYGLPGALYFITTIIILFLSSFCKLYKT